MAAAAEPFELLDFVLVEACGLIQQTDCLNWVAMASGLRSDFGQSTQPKVPTLTSARTVAFFFHAELRRIMIRGSCLNCEQAEGARRCWKIK